jgi:hypothetical protein
MTLSNALPIQFWLEDEETYNEKQVCGIEDFCWCQPWNCGTELPLQFQDDEDIEYSLDILDEDDNILQTLPFEQTQIFTDDYFASFPLSGFTNEAGSGTDWTTGANPSVSISGILASSDNLVESITGIPAGDYILKLGFDVNSIAYTLSINFFKNGVSVGSTSFSITDPNGGISRKSLTLSDAPDTIKLRLSSVSGSKSITLYSLEMNKNGYYYSLGFTPTNYCDQKVKFKIMDETTTPRASVAKSDCVLMKESHQCTKEITYSNASNFAGLIYDNVSPEVEFKTLIPAIFFEEENPSEREDHELSNGEIVRLYNKLEKKKRLDIGFVPFYMHEKIQLILMHDNVEIDGAEWIQRDEYEKREGNRTFPLRRASVFLHDKDFITENQL